MAREAWCHQVHAGAYSGQSHIILSPQLTRTTKYHTPSSTRALGETVWTTLGKDHILDFDGTVELIVPDVEALQKALDDPMYRETVQPDEEAFIDGEKSYRSVGYEQTYIVDGKVL